MTTVREVVATISYHDLCGKLLDVVDQLKNWLEEVPVEFHDQVGIDLDTSDDWGSLNCTGTVYYYRPMNDAELEEQRRKEARTLRICVSEAEANLERARAALSKVQS